MKKLYLFIMFAVLASLGFANAATVTDVLTAKLFTATSNSYTDFSNVTVTSSAVYAGNSAKSDAGAIQLRSKKNNSGIVTTASAGTVRKITVVWDDATASGRTIDVYGKSTAYSSDTDLFGSADVQGVLIGSIAKGKSELVVEGDYQFIGIRSNFGAIYVTSISVEWEAGSTPAELKAPVISGVENGVEYKSAKVAISYPAGATSMTWAVTKDGAAWKGGDATSAVSVDVTEDGSLTSAPIEAEFEIVPEPVITAPTFSLAEGTYTGTQIVTIEGYRGSMIVGTCNDDDVYDYSPCDVTLAAPATGEITYVLTVHSELGEKQGEESTATYVIKAGEPAAEGAFHLVTSAEMLKEGAKVILVSETNAMSTVQNVKNAAKQYRQSTTVVVDGNVVPSVGTDVAVFTVGKDGDNYTFYNAATKTETGAAMPGYLCAVSNEKNALGVESTLSDNGKWSVEFAGSTVKMLAQGEFTRNLLQFNYNGFRCYKPSTTTIDTKLSIYCQVESGVDDATADMVKIIGEEGAIRVVAESADVTVYTMTGQTVAVAAVDGEATIRLAAGFYIVRVGSTTVKVVVK